MGYRFAYLLILIVLSNLMLEAQYDRTTKTQYNQINYTKDDGLPSNECFSVTQDADGYIWTSTDKGIARFDGNQFKVFGLRDGLSTAVIYKVIPSPLGGIVYMGAENSLGMIRNDSVIPIYQTDTTQKVQGIYAQKDYFILSYMTNAQYDVFDWSGQLLKRKHLPPRIHIIELPDSTTFTAGNFYATTDTAYFYYQHANGQWDTLPRNGRYPYILSTYIGDTKYISFGQELYSLRKGRWKKNSQFNNVIYGLFHNLDNNELWITTKSGIHITSMDTTLPDKKLLSGESITAIFKDRHNNLWVSSETSGLYQLKAAVFNTIHTQKTKRIIYHQDTLFSIEKDSCFVKYHLSTKKQQKVQLGTRLEELILYQKKVHVSGWSFNRQDELDYFLPVENGMMTVHPRGIISAKYGYIQLPLLFPGVLLPLDKVEPNYTYCFAYLSEKLLIGRTNGLYQISEKDNHYTGKLLTHHSTTCIATKNNFYYVGTKGLGLIIYDSLFSPLDTLNTNNDLLGDFIKKIVPYQQYLFVNTNNGISVLSVEQPQYPQLLLSITTSNGLLSNAVNDLFIARDTLFVASNKGLQFAQVHALEPPQTHPIPLIELINDTPFSPDTMTLISGTKNIKLKVTSILFQNWSNQTLEYRIPELNTKWTVTKTPDIEIANLTPGFYTFEFRSKFIQHDNYNLTQKTVYIPPFFYETTWFKILVILFFLLLISLGIILRIKNIKQRSKALIQQEQLKYQALTSQLNPHFIANALGSIQHLIVTEQNDTASEYLSNFSRLINHTLKNTQTPFISWANEIDFINKYVEIERSRFEKPFDFDWVIDPCINLHGTTVPTMFLQPFIENAILHGINPLKKRGKIEVIIQRISEDHQTVEIIDNGVGFKSNKNKVKRKNRHSLAIKNIRKRLESINKIYHKTYSQSIEELKDPNNIITGTRVKLIIPFKKMDNDKSLYN